MYANSGGTLTNTANVLWVALAEKAYVQMNESGWLRSSTMGGGVNAYASIALGWFSVTVSQITARTSTTTSMTSTTGNDFNTFKTAYDAGKFIGFASLSTPANTLIAGGHQYVAVGYDSVSQSVILFNPWGLTSGASKPGLVTMKWSTLATSFSYWDRA